MLIIVSGKGWYTSGSTICKTLTKFEPDLRIIIYSRNTDKEKHLQKVLTNFYLSVSLKKPSDGSKLLMLTKREKNRTSYSPVVFYICFVETLEMETLTGNFVISAGPVRKSLFDLVLTTLLHGPRRIYICYVRLG